MAKKKVTKESINKKREAGEQLTTEEIEFLITVGSAEVWLTRRPREGAEKGIPVQPGKVRNFVHDYSHYKKRR